MEAGGSSEASATQGLQGEEVSTIGQVRGTLERIQATIETAKRFAGPDSPASAWLEELYGATSSVLRDMAGLELQAESSLKLAGSLRHLESVLAPVELFAAAIPPLQVLRPLRRIIGGAADRLEREAAFGRSNQSSHQSPPVAPIALGPARSPDHANPTG